MNLSKTNNDLQFGEGVAFWLLREDPSYTKVNYTFNNAQLFGSSVNYF